MLVELHMIQNFAPSNLNRDDTGSPKDCEFGGVRRARISSQCIKRAIRREFKQNGLLDSERIAERTRLVTQEIADRLARLGRDREQATRVAGFLLSAAKLKVDNSQRTEYLLFLGRGEIDAITALCNERWDQLAPLADQSLSDQSNDKKKAAQQVPADMSRELLARLDGGKAADLALFGRMLADLPDKNIDAASQVAHAISTHRVSIEFDFYTAVDDLQPESETGAGMMGTVEFNSACFYRYSNVSMEQLMTNLQGDKELALKTLEAFIHASVRAIPTGKQNSMAAHNPPSMVFAVVREGAPWSLANAFARPVAPGREEDLVGRSIQALDSYWGKLVSVYGGDDIRKKALITLEDVPLQHLGDARVETVKALVEQVVAAVGGA